MALITKEKIKAGWQRPLALGWLLTGVLIFLLKAMVAFSYLGSAKSATAYLMYKWGTALTLITILIAALYTLIQYPKDIRTINLVVLLPLIPFILFCFGVFYMHQQNIFF